MDARRGKFHVANSRGSIDVRLLLFLFPLQEESFMGCSTGLNDRHLLFLIIRLLIATYGAGSVD